MPNSLDNNQALIIEYKEKNDTLNGLLAKYSDYADENEHLKIALATVRAELTERATTAEKANEQLAHQLKGEKLINNGWIHYMISLPSNINNHQLEETIARISQDIITKIKASSHS